MHQFNADPLPMVWLQNGFAATIDGGRTLVRYERLSSLLAALHRAVVLKPALLGSAEIAYLRRALDLPQSELADILGTSEQTLSLWERGSHAIPRSADTLLRKHCIEAARSVFGRTARQYTVLRLARLARSVGTFIYVGGLSGNDWLFEHQPALTHTSAQSSSVVTAIPSVAVYPIAGQIATIEVSAVGNIEMGSPVVANPGRSLRVRWRRPAASAPRSHLVSRMEVSSNA